jgi:hypothetical protein
MFSSINQKSPQASISISILIIISALTILIFNIGCNDKATNPIFDPPSPLLETDSTKKLTVNDFHVSLSQRGLIENGFLKNGNETIWCITLAGLWIGVVNNGDQRANIVITKAIPYSNFSSKWETKPLGVYSLKSGQSYNSENWPVKYGAPVNLDGTPKIYGDEMCWTSLRSDTTTTHSIFSSPIKGLRVTQAIYGYKKDELRNVVFIKYGITNMSSEIWNNVYTGFYSDTDLNDALDNRTGYDMINSISYTYLRKSNYVTGFSYIETPKNVSILSHRIMRKNNYINEEYGEYSFNEPLQIFYAFKGLSNYGVRMTNPVTGEKTNFAFTGSPVLNTGWLDDPIDVRSLLSTESFSLSPGETTWITVAWVITDDVSLANSLKKLKTQFEEIRKDASLWKFN